MSSYTRSIVRFAAGTAIVAFVAGGVFAAWEIGHRDWVLEFQAGPRSPWSERIVAIAHQAALEGLGFGLVGLLIALLAALWNRARGGAEGAGFGRRGTAALVTLAAAFAFWVVQGTFLGGVLLPFLEPLPLLLLNLLGFALTLVAFGTYRGLVRFVPWCPRDEPVANAIASAVVPFWLASQALDIVRRESGGWKSPARLAIVAAIVLVSIPAAALLGRLIAPLVARVRERLERGSLVPLPVTIALLLALFGCALGTASVFRISAATVEADYATLPSRGAPEGPNVVFVTVDTLRADHLGCYGYERPTSPFIDSIAADGTVFADATASAAWTKPATGSILTGLYPSRHGALYHGSVLQVPEGEQTLAEAFQRAGYVTAGFVTNPNIKRVFAFDRGFDLFFDSPVEDTTTLAVIRGSYFGRTLMKLFRHQFNWKYENDVMQMNERILPWIEAHRERPFFLYLHYIDPHIPYSPPGEFRRRFARDHGFPLANERKEKVGIDLYDGEIRYTDDGIAELVGTLRRLGLWDRTLFFLTSDHGEEFYEHEVLGHGFSLYQPVLHVPLIARGPGIPAGRVVPEPVQIVDLAATVLDLAQTGNRRLGDGSSFAAALLDEGWREPGQYYLENEFGQDDGDQRAFVFNGVRSGPWKLVLTEQNAFFPPQRYGGEALYNLDEDPGETKNLIHEEGHREIVERMLEGLRKHATFLAERGFRDHAPTVMTPEIEANLRALGY